MRKTNRLLIVHEAWVRGASAPRWRPWWWTRPSDYLDAPIARLGAPHTPMPTTTAWSFEVIPSQERIVEAIRGLM